MKILVNLGFNWANRLNEWDSKWRANEAFDKLPYGYCWVEEEDIKVDYLEFTNKEKKALFNNNFLLKLYFYLIKVPFNSIKYDIIWTHNDRDTLYLGILKSIPFIKRFIPKVVGNIIWLTDKKLFKVKKSLISYLLKKIDRITVLSNAQIRHLVEIFDLKLQKISYITYGLNKEIYSDTKYINKPSKKLNDEFILMVGTDIHRDVEFFKNLTVLFPNEQFVFATNNNEYLNDSYNKNVITIKCTLTEMKWLYKNCKYVILPLKNNTHASGCTTIIEVALQKKAVVVTDIAGLDDYYIKGETVQAVKLNDINAFAHAMEILNIKENREKMGKKAYEKIYKDEVYSSKKYAYEFLKISKSLFN